MKVGYADAEITPPPGVELTGYGYFLNRRAETCLDPLRVRACVLAGNGDPPGVLVQLDLLCLDREFTGSVRRAAQERFGLEPERVLLHCTHTHTGPAVLSLYGCGLPDPEVVAGLRRTVVETIGRALDALRPAGNAQWFEGEWPQGFAWNRTGGADLDVRVRGVHIPIRGAPALYLLSYACHPVTLGAAPVYSADYCGALAREFEAYGVHTLFLNGPCGDINPANTAVGRRGDAATLAIYGRDLARAFRRAEAAGALPLDLAGARAVSRNIPLEIEPIDPESLEARRDQVRAALQEKTPQSGRLQVEAEWIDRMLRHLERGALDPARSAEIQGLRFGDLVIVGLAAETFTRLGWIIREGLPDRRVLLAATSNGVIGYISTREDLEKGGYAGTAACRIYGMPIPRPGAGEEWARAGAAALRDL